MRRLRCFGVFAPQHDDFLTFHRRGRPTLRNMMTAFAVQLPHVDQTIDSDLDLARRCAEGDTDAFESIYHTHAERMKSVAYHHLGNVADAEDAVQETFLKIHRAASTYTGEAAFGTWLYRILVNTCYDAMRRRRRRPQEAPIDDVVTLTRAASNVDDAKRMMLARLLRELPEQRRTVFVLFEIE